MRLPKIQITTNDLKMNYEIQDATQKIRQPKAEQTIEQPAATLEINTTDGKLSIDSSQARRDIGMIGPLESTKNFAQKGTQLNLEGIAKRVREGRQLMLSAGKGQGRATLQNIAKQNHGPKRPGPYNIKFVPSIGSVKIDYTPGTINIDSEANSPKIDTKVNKPIHDYTPGKVTGTMVQRPTISIDVLK